MTEAPPSHRGLEPTGPELVPVFFPGTARSYDRVVRWTTLGRDASWKRSLLARLPPCRAVLELACGTGILTARLFDRHPGVRVVGIDITDEYLEIARSRLGARGKDFEWVLGDAARTPVASKGPFDAVVSCYLPKYVDADELLRTVTPALRPGAVAVFHDFTRPRGALPRFFWRLWFGVLNVVAPRLHPEWKRVFDRSLTGLIERSKWVREFRAALRCQGYVDVEVERLTYGAATIVAARRPG